jgi:hypothetical protein
MNNNVRALFLVALEICRLNHADTVHSSDSRNEKQIKGFQGGDTIKASSSASREINYVTLSPNHTGSFVTPTVMFKNVIVLTDHHPLTRQTTAM